MTIARTIQVLFLIGAVLFECYLMFAASLYVPWKSASYLIVVVAGGISILLITCYVLAPDKHVEKSHKGRGTVK